MNINFDMNAFNNDEIFQIIQICQSHYQCINCPVLEHCGLNINNQFGQPIKLSCSTAIIRNMQNGNSKM